MTAVTPTELHCTACGALPDEPCRQSDGKSVPPHGDRRQAFEASRAMTVDYVDHTGPLVRVGVWAPADSDTDKVAAAAQDHLGTDAWPTSIDVNLRGFEVVFEAGDLA